MKVKRFIFNPFQENTYILYDDTGNCVIIDAGNYNKEESSNIADFLLRNKLTPKYLLNTHAHIDHILGNRFINIMYHLVPHFHKDDLFLYETSGEVAQKYGIDYVKQLPPYEFIDEDSIIEFGDTKLKCIHIPGHSPGGICFYNEEEGILISGDVLFRESIGRTDLPGGDYKKLIINIKKKLLKLPGDTVVYPGHMEETSIGHEKTTNPFLR